VFFSALDPCTISQGAPKSDSSHHVLFSALNTCTTSSRYEQTTRHFKIPLNRKPPIIPHNYTTYNDPSTQKPIGTLTHTPLQYTQAPFSQLKKHATHLIDIITIIIILKKLIITITQGNQSTREKTTKQNLKVKQHILKSFPSRFQFSTPPPQYKIQRNTNRVTQIQEDPHAQRIGPRLPTPKITTSTKYYLFLGTILLL
jgi:hypothetical protein